jgi:hypothetical protein
MTKDELSHELGTIHSAAAEGALLARLTAQGRTKPSFVRVHGRDLSDTAESRAQKLQDGGKPASLKPQIEKAIELASSISSDLSDMALKPHDRALAADTEKKLLKEAQDAQNMEDSL